MHLRFWLYWGHLFSSYCWLLGFICEVVKELYLKNFVWGKVMQDFVLSSLWEKSYSFAICTQCTTDRVEKIFSPTKRYHFTKFVHKIQISDFFANSENLPNVFTNLYLTISIRYYIVLLYSIHLYSLEIINNT